MNCPTQPVYDYTPSKKGHISCPFAQFRVVYQFIIVPGGSHYTLTTEIWITLGILLISAILFFTELVRVDLIALLVMGSLALSGVLTSEQALSGFSNPAVVTVWAMFIISGGLSRTGIANAIGRRIFKLAGVGEIRLIVTIMLTAGVLSAFMNNVGVAALLLPVVMDISRRTNHPPSRLLMPLAMGCLLGGMMTLIGTPPNLLTSNALREYGLEPFQLFDFTPTGSIIFIGGVIFIALVARTLLPKRDISKEIQATSLADLEQVYDLSSDLYIVQVPGDSILAGKTLAENRIGTVLDINVLGIIHNKKTSLAPGPDEVIQGGDKLIVTGDLAVLNELHGRQHLIIETNDLKIDDLVSEEIVLAELEISTGSRLVGKTLRSINFRSQFHVIVLAIRRDGLPIRTSLDELPLKVADVLLIQGDKPRIQALEGSPDFLLREIDRPETYGLDERLLVVRIPAVSSLVGKPISESRLSERLGLMVLGIVRDGVTIQMPKISENFHADDILFVKGKEENISLLRGLQELEIDYVTSTDLNVDHLETEQVGVIETVLSPHTTLSGKTLRQLHFREKFGLSVLAIWREGEIYRANLRELTLRFGDALLLFGDRRKLTVLGSEPDFLVLTEKIQETPRTNRALPAAIIMAGVILFVLIGWISIPIAGVIGAALMVLSGALTMEEAYRYIDWRAVFLIAGMIPLGIAMESSGAANFIATSVLSRLGEFGILAVMISLFVLTSLTSQVMPNAVVAVLMAPIAINTAVDLGVSPYTLMMVVAIAASAAFMSPVAHPANILIMSPGGYRVNDFVRIGLPLTVVVMIIALIIVPIFWPL